MKKIFLLSLLASPYLAAEEYQTFIDLNYARSDVGWKNYTDTSLGLEYYFDNKVSLGPLNEFEYINKTSNVFGRLHHKDVSDDEFIGGNAFVGGFLIGASYSHSKYDDYFGDSVSRNTKSVSLGYLASDNLLFKVDIMEPDSGKNWKRISASYNHQIDEKDYLGFTLATNDDADYYSLSSTYFKALDNGAYFKTQLELYTDDYRSRWDMRSDYFFNELTSIFASTGKDDFHTIGARHFFNSNFSTELSYSRDTDDDSVDSINLSLTAQF